MSTGPYARNFLDAIAAIRALPASERSAVANRVGRRLQAETDATVESLRAVASPQKKTTP